MLNNQWVHGRATFEAPALPAELRGMEGIAPMPATLDPLIGEEVLLCWIDKLPFMTRLVNVVPFDLRLKAGLARTSFGPLLFFVFYVPDPDRHGNPYVAVDVHVDPLQEAHLAKWEGLATQSHWHFVYLDENLRLVDLKEFPNTFGVAETLASVRAACKGQIGGSFDLAKSEFCGKYTVTDLLAMA
jgi:hypothetical protein